MVIPVPASRAVAALFASLVMLSGSRPLDSAAAAPAVVVRRVPHNGLQPEVAADPRGILHLVYFAGPPGAGNLFYVRTSDGGETFSSPVRVNSQDGSAIATGTIRGAQLSVGPDGRVHVAWNGSDKALPRGLANPKTDRAGSPMLYARSNARGTAFEPQRNLMTHTYNLDGGGSLAAAPDGAVYVAWHGNAVEEREGEDARRVWIARSTDGGATFARESAAWSEPTGACGCCGMRLLAAADGALHLLYRAATARISRDIYSLTSTDRGTTFRGAKLHDWDIDACPMTSMSLATHGDRVLGAWETDGEVFYGIVTPNAPAAPHAPPASAGRGRRKHPRLAVDRDGRILFAWTEGTAWAKGGALAWQVFSADGKPLGEAGAASGVPVWSVGAVAPRPGGGFVVFY